MMLIPFITKRYDIPLHIKAGGHFTIWIITLMTFLCSFVLYGSLGVHNLTNQWQAGLENNFTIEIKPQLTVKDSLPQIDDQAMQQLVSQTGTILKDWPAVQSFRPLSQEETLALLGSWSEILVSNTDLQNEIPFPTLIAVTLTPGADPGYQSLKTRLNKLSPDILVDTHETWLNDLLTLTREIRNGGLLLALLIATTVIIAVIGAARSRLSMHWSDIELLHLIGASDAYIAKQFARHATHLTLIGSLIGVIPALLILKSFTDQNHNSLFLSLYLEEKQWILLLSLPILTSVIAYATTTFSTKQFLKKLV